MTPGEVAGNYPGLLSGLVWAGAGNPHRPGLRALDLGAGLMTAEEVAELDLGGCALAVLSACETGLGRTAGGEGVLGLQRAFGEAGCRTVIASLWKVDDEATRALMGHFYRCLWEEGLPPLEALRRASFGSSTSRGMAPVANRGSGRPGFSAATLAGCPDSVRYLRQAVAHEATPPTADRTAMA